MKKVLLSVLAAATLVACNNEEILDSQAPGAIAFSGAYVDNVTRAAVDPSTTTASIDAFDVWGFIDETTGVVFNDEDVTKSGAAWGYVNTQYWLPGRNYYFAAIAPMNSANIEHNTANSNEYVLGTLGFTNVDGSEDFLYAAATVTTPEDINASLDPVKFAFNHMLSKVKFSFINGFSNNNTTIEITDINITNAPAKGTINVAQQDWWSTNQWVLGNETVNLAFGDCEVDRIAMGEKKESQKERLTIPADAREYVITFKVQLYFGEVAAFAEPLQHQTVLNGVAFQIGKAYNLVAELNNTNVDPENGELFPIEFAVEEVKDWVVGDDNEQPVEPVVIAATAAELNEAIKTVSKNTTISLAPGVTYEGVEIASPVAENITLKGAEGAVVKGGVKVDLNSFSANGEGWVGFTFDGVAFEDNGVYLVDFAGSPWGKIDGLSMVNCTMTGVSSKTGRLFDLGTDSPGSNQLLNITIQGCTVSEAQQGIRLGGLNGKCFIKNNTITNVAHNAITLRSVAADAVVLVEGNTIANGGDRAFRIGSNLGTVTYKNNVITNTGDPTDGSNYKANSNTGTVTFEGNTVDGAAWSGN